VFSHHREQHSTTSRTKKKRITTNLRPHRGGGGGARSRAPVLSACGGCGFGELGAGGVVAALALASDL